MTYRETIDWLYTIRMFGVKLGLANIEHLLERLGNPHHTLHFVHIAGTNGKGSVAAMVASICQEAGLKTGLYTSPHLVSFCERIQVDRKPIAEDDVVRWVTQLRPVLADIEASGKPHPTFFEIVTALTLLYFREEKTEIVVWETGMGGRLDATNVVTPLVSVITNIHWDHQTYLGTTLEAIAREKAGIIKPRVPVVTATSELEAVEVIEETCRERSAPLVRIGRDIHVRQRGEDVHGQTLELRGTQHEYGELRMPLIGSHQAINTATAVAAVEIAGRQDVSVGAVREGLRQTRWPGRFQLFETCRPRVVLDGAHNIAGVVALKTTLSRHFAEARIVLILGILADKNYAVMGAELAPLADALFIVRVKSDRASDPEELARICRGVNPQARVEVMPELVDAYQKARSITADQEESLIVIAGSLFLVGEAMHRLPLGLHSATNRNVELALQ